MRVFISQPMRGFTEEEIITERRRIEAIFHGNAFVNPYNPMNAKKSKLVTLGNSIAAMDEADIVVVPYDRWSHPGCCIEYEAARRYDIPVCEMVMYPGHPRDLEACDVDTAPK